MKMSMLLLAQTKNDALPMPFNARSSFRFRRAIRELWLSMPSGILRMLDWMRWRASIVVADIVKLQVD